MPAIFGFKPLYAIAAMGRSNNLNSNQMDITLWRAK